jgi:hypothetical protein
MRVSFRPVIIILTCLSSAMLLWSKYPVQASSYSHMTVEVMSPACKIGTLEGECCSTDAMFEELGISGGSEEDGGGNGDGAKAGGSDDDGVRLRCTVVLSCEGEF